MKPKTCRLVLALAAVVAVALGCTTRPETAAGTGKTINSTNYDPSSFTASQISAAAALDVYFEHASVGDCIVGTSFGTSGLALLAATDPRYSCGRASFGDQSTAAVTASDAAWFDSNSGLGDNHRGNPGASAKISYFQASCGVMASHVEVAMFKFCYVDPTADFSSVKSTMESLEAAYPAVTFVWWTMPITTASYSEDSSVKAQRQAYNAAVRSYCAANGKWLLDIADLECHDDSGNVYKDGSGNELLYDGYTSDGGHLQADAGKRKLARAYWTLIVEIAKSRG